MSYPSDFQLGLDFVIGVAALFSQGGVEGGLSNEPDDNGGQTNHGITQSSYDTYNTKKGLPLNSVADLDYITVQDFYYSECWLAAGCDKLPSPINIVHMDWAVNHGAGGAIKSLQVLLIKTFTPVEPFIPAPIFGPKTTALVAQIKPDAVENFSCDYLEYRAEWWQAFANTNPNQQKFLRGEINRLDRLSLYLRLGWAPTLGA